jgi:hypothetical protein
LRKATAPDSAARNRRRGIAKAADVDRQVSRPADTGQEPLTSELFDIHIAAANPN